jgi:Lamin Tail Domain
MKISDLPGWFSQQKLGGKLVIGGVGLFFLICLCSLLSTTFTGLGQSPTITPTYQGADSIVLITWTPDPNSSPTPTGSPTPTSSPVTTRTPLPTSLPTRSFETATIVVLPTVLRPAITRGLVIIVYVDKEEEYVDIQNFSDAPVSLSGWVLVSERGNQSCKLNGVLPSRKVLRIWTGTEPVGYSCGFLRTIWTDKELDPAVLYNQDGKEVSRYP